MKDNENVTDKRDESCIPRFKFLMWYNHHVLMTNPILCLSRFINLVVSLLAPIKAPEVTWKGTLKPAHVIYRDAVCWANMDKQHTKL